jgi:D-3-phosphoglycerate dehydrogenase / 2-oxoglutarate reductase
MDAVWRRYAAAGSTGANRELLNAFSLPCGNEVADYVVGDVNDGTVDQLNSTSRSHVMSAKVLISDKLSVAAVQIFKDNGISVDVKSGLDRNQLSEIICEYDGLVIRSATKVTAELLNNARSLKVIGRAGVGVDNVDVAAATARGIIVMNTPLGNSTTTAEYAISLMMALARQIPIANVSTHAGKWEKDKFLGVELTGKIIGIVGCGNIGSIVADRALGLKMKVVCCDPYLSPERAANLGIEKVEMEDLLRRSDFITLHTTLTDKTSNMIDARALTMVKPGVRIINCARGGLVDEGALRAALESGRVAGAAFDVYTVEPATANPLFGHPNVVCTPHIGAATAEAQENVALRIAEQMSDYLLRGSIANVVNLASLNSRFNGVSTDRPMTQGSNAASSEFPPQP